MLCLSLSAGMCETTSNASNMKTSAGIEPALTNMSHSWSNTKSRNIAVLIITLQLIAFPYFFNTFLRCICLQCHSISITVKRREI